MLAKQQTYLKYLGGLQSAFKQVCMVECELCKLLSLLHDPFPESGVALTYCNRRLLGAREDDARRQIDPFNRGPP